MNGTHRKMLSIPLKALCKFTLFSLLAISFYMMAADVAHATYAAYSSPMGLIACQLVLYMFYGNLGRAVAILAVIIAGVGASLGKISWGLALTIIIGISIVFGAPVLIDKLLLAVSNSWNGWFPESPPC